MKKQRVAELIPLVSVRRIRIYHAGSGCGSACGASPQVTSEWQMKSFSKWVWWCYASSSLRPHELLMESNEINSRPRLCPRSWNALSFCLSLSHTLWHLGRVIGLDSRSLEKKKTTSGPCLETAMWKSYLFCNQWCRSLVLGGQQILQAQFQCSSGAKNGTGSEPRRSG